jgi:LysR family transcriptional regulator, hydrogen peroxide-inducible genes activator
MPLPSTAISGAPPAGVEVRDERIKLLRFADPEPRRTIGLAWRRTSPRKADFIALGRLVNETLGVGPKQSA